MLLDDLLSDLVEPSKVIIPDLPKPKDKTSNDQLNVLNIKDEKIIKKKSKKTLSIENIEDIYDDILDDDEVIMMEID